VFRIAAVAFQMRNFAEGALANANSGLGYEAALLERFFPGPRAAELRARAAALSETIGRDTLAHLRTIHAFVADGGYRDAAAAQELTVALATTINLRNLELGATLEELKLAIRAHGLERRLAAGVVTAGTPGEGEDHAALHARPA
jgi:hypothetical protein